MRKVALFILFLFSFSKAEDFCFHQAGERYGINPMLLYTIAKVESNLNPYAISRNKNGTYDIGLMQINSSWLKELKKYGITQNHLFNPCQNIHTGAWILRQCINRYGNSWKSIDCYNKGFKAKESSKYVWKIYQNYQKLFGFRSLFENNDVIF